MKIPQAILRFSTSPVLSAYGNSLRGFFSRKEPGNLLTHNHLGSGRYLYAYPRIQYKALGEEGLVLGIAEGAEQVPDFRKDLDELELNGKRFEIVGKKVSSSEVVFGCSDSPIEYEFLTPWLALNERNHGLFLSQANGIETFSESLKKILIGNLLSISKSLGYVVERMLLVDSCRFEKVETFLKGVKMVGFRGTFKVNFHIPDFWGLGKSPARGFGTVARRKKGNRTCS